MDRRTTRTWWMAARLAVLAAVMAGAAWWAQAPLSGQITSVECLRDIPAATPGGRGCTAYEFWYGVIVPAGAAVVDAVRTAPFPGGATSIAFDGSGLVTNFRYVNARALFDPTGLSPSFTVPAMTSLPSSAVDAEILEPLLGDTGPCPGGAGRCLWSNR